MLIGKLDCLKQYIPEAKKQDVGARGDEEIDAAATHQRGF